MEVAEGEKTRSSSSDIRVEISAMENRICRALDDKLENLFSPTRQSELVALIQSTIIRCLQDSVKKMGDATARQIKDLEAAIVKGVVAIFGARPSSPVHADKNNGRSIQSDLVPVSGTILAPTNGSKPVATDFSTQAEYVDRIDDVLRDLNSASDPPIPPSPVADATKHTTANSVVSLDDPARTEQVSIALSSN